jgi:predicted TIM-barrel fold metal-dependent hydrolase
MQQAQAVTSRAGARAAVRKLTEAAVGAHNPGQMALSGFEIIDADGHVTEPHSLYITHIDPKFREQAERMLRGAGAGNLALIRALHPAWRSAARPLGEEHENPSASKFPSGRNHPLASPAGGYDPHERIRDMDREGIDIAVCFATVATSICAIEDNALEAAFARAYNRWLGEYCGAYPARIKGVGIIPQHDMQLCAAEVKWLASQPWCVGVMTFGNLGGRLADHPYFNPLYAALQDADLPLCFHGGTDRPPFAPGRDDVGNNMFMMHLTGHAWHQMRAMGAAIGGGLFERFPELRIGFFEGGISWVGWWAERMDGHYKHFSAHTPHLARKPSEHMRGARCFFTFDPDEELLPEAISELGEGCLMWASDYPHFDASFPDAAEMIVNHRRLNEGQKRRLLADNARAFYTRLSR